MSGKKRRRKTVSLRAYRHPLNINIGVIIFAVMLLYIIICVFLFFAKKHVTRYEVRNGSLSIANTYEGLILRSERVVSANSSGYVNYFAKEGSKVACGDLVYTIDQTGKIAELLGDDIGVNLLSGNDLSELKSDLVQFQHNYKDDEFSNVYDFTFSLEGTALKLSNYNMYSRLQSLGDTGGHVDYCTSDRSGVVVYHKDGYENMTVAALCADYPVLSDVEREFFDGNRLVGPGDPVYTLITSENWSVVIPVEKDRVQRLVEEEYVNIRFLKNEYTSWAKVNKISEDDKKAYVELQFNNSMITFAKDRIIDIEIILNDDEGLKIPNSALVNKDFYLIPKEYLTPGGSSSDWGFLRETYDEEGNMSKEFLSATIYSENEDEYYVDTSVLRPGDYVCIPDSDEKYPVSKTGSLTGVYNINKGFADFKEVTVLYSNDEYSIVKSNTRYGLTEYDYIVLDAESVNKDDFIFE